MTDKAKMLERVRALLAKADGTNFAAEADAFRAKADELMTAYAIEQWQIDAAQDGVNARPMPEKRDLDISWYYEAPFRHQLWRVFVSLAAHCRCKVFPGRGDYYKSCPIIGLPADLDYLDLLFTHLAMDLSNKVDPKPSDRLSYEENLAMLKEAGLSWPDIAYRMHKAGMLAWVTTTDKDRWGEEVEVPEERRHDIRKNYAKPAHDYRRWCKKNNVPQSYTNWKTYRRNFAEGYADAIRLRLYAMRREQESAYDASHQAGGMQLVVRDIYQAIEELSWDIWPELRPHPADCECAECHADRCEDPKCDRPLCKERRKPVRYRTDNRKIDWAAQSAGKQAGDEARLAVHQGQRIAPRKELDS